MGVTAKLPREKIEVPSQGVICLVAEIAGTIPPVKERPKVARRPTIAAAPAPRSAPVAKTVSATDPASGTHVIEKSEKTNLALSNPAKRFAAKLAASSADRPKTAKARTVTGPQMLSVKERPKVARQSTILAPAAGAPKRVPKAVAALPKPEVTSSAHAQPAAAKEIKSEPAKVFRWTSWLPIAAGIAISSMAPQLFGLAGHWNPWGQRVLFPLVQLVGLHEIGMSDELTRTLPQLMLYLQFPLEGLLVASNLRRGMQPGRAFAPLPGLHFVCALVLWIVALGAGPMI